jgi:hypothetical protein
MMRALLCFSPGAFFLAESAISTRRKFSTFYTCFPRVSTWFREAMNAEGEQFRLAEG